MPINVKYACLLGIVLIVFIFLCVVSYIGVFEDAFISFRYARNFARGNGFVFNPESHVWGYSNFLWTLLLGLGLKAGLSVIALSKYLGVGSACLILCIFFYWSVGHHKISPLQTAVGPLFLATSTHFLIAAQNGMETLFFTFLIFTGTLLHITDIAKEKPFPRYAVFFLAASLTRPEGPLLMLCAGIIDSAVLTFTRRKYAFKRLYLAAVIFIAGYGFYMFAMYMYYGFPFPNSYYAKVAFQHGLTANGIQYVHNFLSDIRAGFLLWPLIFIFTDRERRLKNSIILFYLLGYLVFVIMVGGDYKIYFYRFMIPMLPYLFLLLSSGIHSFCKILKKIAPGLASAVLRTAVCLFLLSVNFAAVRSPIVPFFSSDAQRTPLVLNNLACLAENPARFFGMVDTWTSDKSLDITSMGMVGQKIPDMIKRNESIGTCQCGQIPFYLEKTEVFDMCGLMDDHVAQRGGLDLDYLISRDVDNFILFYSEDPQTFFPATLFPHILFSTYFLTNYRLEHVFHHTSRLMLSQNKYDFQKQMLLFTKKEGQKNEKEEIMKRGNLKKAVYDTVKAGNVTYMLNTISGCDKGEKRVKIPGNKPLETLVGYYSSADRTAELPQDGQKQLMMPLVLTPQHRKISFQKEVEAGYAYDVWIHVLLEKESDRSRISFFTAAIDAGGKTLAESHVQNLTDVMSYMPPGIWTPLKTTLSTKNGRKIKHTLKTTVGGVSLDGRVKIDNIMYFRNNRN